MEMVVAWCIRLLLVALVRCGCPFGEDVRLLHITDKVCTGLTPHAPFEEAVATCFAGLDKKTNPVVFPDSRRTELNKRLLAEGIPEVWVPVQEPYAQGAFLVHSLPSDPEYNKPAELSEMDDSEGSCVVYNIELAVYQRRNCEEFHVAVCEMAPGHVRYVVGPVCPPGQVAVPSHKACFSVTREDDVTQGIITYVGLPQPSVPFCDSAAIRNSHLNTEGMLLLREHLPSLDSSSNEMCVFSQTSPLQISKLMIELHESRSDEVLFVVIKHPERFVDMECFTDSSPEPHPVPVHTSRMTTEKVALDYSGDGYYWCLGWDELADTVEYSNKLLVVRAALQDSPSAVLVRASPTLTAGQLSQALGVPDDALKIKRKLKTGFLLHLLHPVMEYRNVRVLYVRNTRTCPSTTWGENPLRQTTIGMSVSVQVGGTASRMICGGDYTEGGYWVGPVPYMIDIMQKKVVILSRASVNKLGSVILLLSFLQLRLA